MPDAPAAWAAEDMPWDQLDLFPRATKRPRLYKGSRFSVYRYPVLLWLAAQRAATVHQTVYRFWCLAGRSGSHGYRVLQDLVQRGLVDRRPLHPWKGAASLQVLTLTPAGWREVGQQPARDPRVGVEHLLQFAHVCLEREAEGWVLVPPAELWLRLRRRALDSIRRPGSLEHEREMQRVIERSKDVRVGLWGIWHERSSQVRIIVPARSLAGAARACHRLFPLRLIAEAERLQLELVAGDEDLASRAAKMIERQFAGSRRRRRGGRGTVWPRLPVTVHVAAHFGTLPHPADAEATRVSRYAESNAPSPLMLRSPSVFMATRGNGAL